jgi:hypothetical protein
MDEWECVELSEVVSLSERGDSWAIERVWVVRLTYRRKARGGQKHGGKAVR